MSATRVLLADDHLLFRKGLQALLSAQPDVEVVGEAPDGAEAVRQAQKLRPDIVLMDIHMPGTDGLRATQQIKQELPDIKVLILTVSDEDDDLFEAIKAGADGYLLKNMHPDELLERLREATRGEAPLSSAIATKVLAQFRRWTRLEAPAGSVATLTRRERQVLTLVAQGLSNKEIATRLVLTEGTVKNHLHSILERMHLENRVQATAVAIQEGLTTASSPAEDDA